MIDEFRLPPRRELPPEVRERMRVTITSGLPRRSPRGRMLAVAAAVVVFVVGAAAVTQFVRPRPAASPVASPSPTSSPSPTVNSSGVLDRCWAGVKLAGRTGVPDRSSWVVVSAAQDGDDTVVAFTAAGKPMFCEATATTVTLSDPNATPAYAPGTHTALLLYTGTGLVAGVADPTWPGVELSFPDSLGIGTADAVGPSRQFTLFTHTDPATSRLWARRYVDGQNLTTSRSELPVPPAPLFSVVDQPAERSSAAGQALGRCLSDAPHSPADPDADPDAYVAGAMLTSGLYQVVLGRSPEHAVVCLAQPDPAALNDPAKVAYQVYVDTFVGQSIPVRRLSVPAFGPNGSLVPFIGIVTPSTATMTADFGLGNSVGVPVVNGTFAIWLPTGSKALLKSGNTPVVASDAQGMTLFNGDIPMK